MTAASHTSQLDEARTDSIGRPAISRSERYQAVGPLRWITRPALIMREGLLRLRCWWVQDRCMQALANLDDEQLSDLSEVGQRLRRKALRQRPRKP
jgi:hypothetical protein